MFDVIARGYSILHDFSVTVPLGADNRIPPADIGRKVRAVGSARPKDLTRNCNGRSAAPVGDCAGIASSEDETLSGVGGVPPVVPVVDIDLPCVDEDR
jgi:hypothetical protein